jgi:hypothetical protein
VTVSSPVPVTTVEISMSASSEVYPVAVDRSAGRLRRRPVLGRRGRPLFGFVCLDVGDLDVRHDEPIERPCGAAAGGQHDDEARRDEPEAQTSEGAGAAAGAARGRRRGAGSRL